MQFGKTCWLTSLRSNAVEKIPWHGVLTSVQPRIRLGRSFDQRSHTYLGYALRVRGNMGSEAREFLVGVGESAPLRANISEPSLVLLINDQSAEKAETKTDWK